MGFHWKHFISRSSQDQVQDELGKLRGLPEDLNDCLLFGPEGSGKTAILFHYAVKLAREGKSVLYVRPASRYDEIPPVLPHGVHAKDLLLANIQVKYVHSKEQLMRFGACLHLLPFIPDAVILDDITTCTELGGQLAKDAELLKILALLRDAVTHFRRSGRPCPLIVSASANETPPSRYIYEHWLPLFLRLKDAKNGLLMSVDAPLALARTSEELLYSCDSISGVVLHRIEPAPG